MKSKLSGLICLAVVGLMLSLPQNADAVGPQYDSSRWAKMTRKLLRGIGNITFGWVEVPVRINEEVQNLDPFTGTFTGVCLGLRDTGRRFVAGVIELVTFPFALPNFGYDPLIEPEFVMQEK